MSDLPPPPVSIKRISETVANEKFILASEIRPVTNQRASELKRQSWTLDVKTSGHSIFSGSVLFSSPVQCIPDDEFIIMLWGNYLLIIIGT